MNIENETRKLINRIRYDLDDPLLANLLDMVSFSIITKCGKITFHDLVKRIVVMEEYILGDN